MMSTGTFTLEQDVLELLASFKKKYKIPKSVTVNSLLKHYIGKIDTLFKLIIGDENEE